MEQKTYNYQDWKEPFSVIDIVNKIIQDQDELATLGSDEELKEHLTPQELKSYENTLSKGITQYTKTLAKYGITFNRYSQEIYYPPQWFAEEQIDTVTTSFDHFGVKTGIKDKELVEAQKSLTTADLLKDDIPELHNDPIHKFLRKNKLYNTYFVLWRIQFAGLYESIPFHFIISMQNLFRYSNKLTYYKNKESNERIFTLNGMEISSSGSGKSARADFHKFLFKKVNVPIANISAPTPQSLRGSVDNQGGKVSLQEGMITNALLFIEEWKTTIKKCVKEENYTEYLLNLLEKSELEGDTLAAKSFVNTWLKEQSQPEDKKKYHLEKETYVYRIDETTTGTGDLVRKLKFKNHAGFLIYSQPILSRGAPTEIAIQKSLLDQGIYNRVLIAYDPRTVLPDQEKKYYDEQKEYHSKLLKLHNQDLLEIQDKLITQFEKYFQILPQKEIFLDPVFLNKLGLLMLEEENIPEKIRNIFTSIEKTETAMSKTSFLLSYGKRLKTVHCPLIIHTLTYLEGYEEPTKEIINIAIEFCNQRWVDFANYLEDALEEPIITKYAQNKDYKKIILEVIQGIFFKSKKENSEEANVYKHYPSKSQLQTKVKKHWSVKISDNFNIKQFTRTLEELENDELIKIVKQDDEGNNFEKNMSKVVLWDSDKNEVRYK